MHSHSAIYEREFEKRDVSLAGKLDAKHAEKSDIVSRVAECQVIMISSVISS